MITARRPLQARHELRFGTRELVMFCAVFVLVWGLTFVFGILVGRELASPGAGPGAGKGASAGSQVAGRSVAAEPVKKEHAGPPGSASSQGPSAPATPATEDRLTFYKTLTAPTVEIPASAPPVVEERIVPREAPSTAPAARVLARVPPRAEAVPADPVPERPPVRRRAETAAAPASATPAVLGAAAAATASNEPIWTVQVSSFRNRALADELRARLAGKGFDAYLVSFTTEEGRVRHRVRVGAFPTRTEAERVAGDLRAERNLNPFVTTRQR